MIKLCVIFSSLCCFLIITASAANSAPLGHFTGDPNTWTEGDPGIPGMINRDAIDEIFVLWDFYLEFTDPPQDLFGSDYTFVANFDERSLTTSSWQISNGIEAYSGQVLEFENTFIYHDYDTETSFYETRLVLDNDYFNDLVMSGTSTLAFPQPFSMHFFAFEGDLTGTPVPIPSTIWFLGSGLIGFLGLRGKF